MGEDAGSGIERGGRGSLRDEVRHRVVHRLLLTAELAYLFELHHCVVQLFLVVALVLLTHQCTTRSISSESGLVMPTLPSQYTTPATPAARRARSASTRSRSRL